MDTIRAWKDPEYRAELSEADLASLTSNPAGFVELSDDELETVAAGTGPACVSAITAVTALSVQVCSPNGTACGSCSWGTSGCC